MERTEDEEQKYPLCPGTRCRAVFKFDGVYPCDLPFREGDVIEIIEPCSSVFWYLAKNKNGREGVVPISFIEICAEESESPSIENSRSPSFLSKRPPAPLPPVEEKSKSDQLRLEPIGAPSLNGKYKDMNTFRAKSGWFYPSLDEVLMRKIKFQNLPLFQSQRTGAYAFLHKSKKHLGYVGKSHNIYSDLTRLFESLYIGPESSLNPVQLLLRTNHPDEKEWTVRFYSCRLEELDFEVAKHIVHHETLHPKGLNKEIFFGDQIHWETFCKFRTDKRHKRKK